MATVRLSCRTATRQRATQNLCQIASGVRLLKLGIQTSKVEQSRIKTIPCPVCLGTSFHRLFDKDNAVFVRCTSDGLVLVNPQPSQDFLAGNYNKAANSPERYPTHFETVHREYRRFRSTFRQFWQTGRILDMGTGSGEFLVSARNDGWKPFGVELNQQVAEYARSER